MSISSPEVTIMHRKLMFVCVLGDKNLPVDYKVEHLRDGANFSARKIVGEQNGKMLFAAQMSFCPMKVGSQFRNITFNNIQKNALYIKHHLPMPCVSLPENCLSRKEIFKAESLDMALPIERRKLFERSAELLSDSIEPAIYSDGLWEDRIITENVLTRRHKAPPICQQWVRFPDAKSIPTILKHTFISYLFKDLETRQHHALLALFTDAAMAMPSFMPHIGDFDEASTHKGMPSLDHSLWFHDFDFSCADWILYEVRADILSE
jgi:acyl-CoA thioesterase II